MSFLDRLAGEIRVPIIGSLGILLLAKRKGLTSHIRPMIDILQKSQIFISEALVDEALKLAGEVDSKPGSW